MGFVLLIVGLLMIVTGARGTYAQFGSQLASDFTGQGNFTWWIVSVGAVGSIGYIDALRTFSRLFLTLILAAFLLSNRGFFANLTAALQHGPTPPKAVGSGQTNVQAVQSGQITPEQGLNNQQSNLGGEPATSSGQAKFNGWLNYFFGTNQGTGAAQ